MKENWTYKKFSEVFNLQMGKTPSRDNLAYWGGNNVWVSIADLKDKYIESSKEHITDIAVSESGINKVPQGTAIMSFKLTIGRSAITKCDLFTNEAIMSFEPKEKNILAADYIYYYLKGCKWTGANKAVMGQTLNKKTISENIFAYPSIEIQSRIVFELDLLQSIIDKQQAQLKELDTLAQAVFYDMFGDPVENEKGWEVKKLEEIMSIPSRNGLTKPTAIRGTGVPMISMGELFANPIIKDSIKATLVPVSKKEIELSQIIRGDLLFARQSLSLEGAGKCSFVESCLQPTVFESHIIRIRVDNCVTHPRYVFYYFLSPYGKSEIRKRVYQVAAAGIKGSELIKIPIPIPPLSLQQSFVEKIEAIEQQKARIRQSIAETQRLFDYTMDKYFG